MTKKKGIKISHTKMEVFSKENRVKESGEGTPAEVMILKLDELKK